MRVIALILCLLAGPAFAQNYLHAQATEKKVTQPAPPRVLDAWHRTNFAWMQVGQKVSPRPAPKGAGRGRWVAWGKFQEFELKHRYVKRCYGTYCKMERQEYEEPGKVRLIDMTTGKEIPTARRRWEHRAGDSGDALRRHLIETHGEDANRLSHMSDEHLREIHSHAHEGTGSGK